jgi:hypothetical protein
VKIYVKNKDKGQQDDCFCGVASGKLSSISFFRGK